MIEGENRLRRAAFTLVGLVAAVFAVGADVDACATEAEHAETVDATPPAAVIDVDAETLAAAYAVNEVAANAEYEGHVLRITGIVARITDERSASIVLAGDGFTDVRCYFSDTERESLIPLRPGDAVTVQGLNAGMGIFNVEVRGCVLEASDADAVVPTQPAPATRTAEDLEAEANADAVVPTQSAPAAVTTGGPEGEADDDAVVPAQPAPATVSSSTEQSFAVHADSGIESTSDMGGAVICVQSGTTAEQNLADHFRDLGLEFTPVGGGDQETQDAFVAGRCDVWAADQSTLASRIGALPNASDFIILGQVISGSSE